MHSWLILVVFNVCFHLATAELKSDGELVLAAAKVDPPSVDLAHPSLMNDPNFWVEYQHAIGSKQGTNLKRSGNI